MFLVVGSYTTARAWKLADLQVELPGEAVTNHDELMSNFFAQPGGAWEKENKNTAILDTGNL